jgi:hypothetical protein
MQAKETMKEPIKIEPNGVNLSAMMGLGNALLHLASELRLCYGDGWSDAMAKHILLRVNANAIALDLPEIAVDFEFIERVKQERES